MFWMHTLWPPLLQIQEISDSEITSLIRGKIFFKINICVYQCSTKYELEFALVLNLPHMTKVCEQEVNIICNGYYKRHNDTYLMFFFFYNHGNVDCSRISLMPSILTCTMNLTTLLSVPCIDYTGTQEAEMTWLVTGSWPPICHRLDLRWPRVRIFYI